MPHDHRSRPDQGWRVLDVPRAHHDSYPPNQRPRLRPTWDVFGWSFLIITVISLVVSALTPAVFMLFPGPGPVALASLYAVIFVAVAWFILSRLLIYRGTPWLLAGAAVLWGMSGSFAIGAFTVSQQLIDLSYSWGIDELALSLGGAYPEELAKALGVWLLLHIGRAWWNRPWHGLVAGMLVGFGFEAFENAGYAVMLGVYHPTSDLAGVSWMWLVRLVAGPLLHAICTGLVGFGIGMAVYAAGLTWKRRLSWILASGLAGFFVHAGWNLQLDSTAATVVHLVGSWGLGAALLVTAIIISTKEARALAAAGRYPAVSIYQRIPTPRPVAPPVVPMPPPGPPSNHHTGNPGWDPHGR